MCKWRIGYAKFGGEGGQIRCIMGNVEVAYRLCKVWGGGQIRCIMGNVEVAYG